MGTGSTILIQLALIALLLQLGAFGSPIETFVGKPQNCPYGKCYIDKCKRICSCSKDGSVGCTKESTLLDCGDASKLVGNCPLGLTYKDPIWSDDFLCYCNNDASQTYECFDLKQQRPADAVQLLKSIRERH